MHSHSAQATAQRGGPPLCACGTWEPETFPVFRPHFAWGRALALSWPRPDACSAVETSPGLLLSSATAFSIEVLSRVETARVSERTEAVSRLSVDARERSVCRLPRVHVSRAVRSE